MLNRTISSLLVYHNLAKKSTNQKREFPDAAGSGCKKSSRPLWGYHVGSAADSQSVSGTMGKSTDIQDLGNTDTAGVQQGLAADIAHAGGGKGIDTLAFILPGALFHGNDSGPYGIGDTYRR